jgi:hypothetical protein
VEVAKLPQAVRLGNAGALASSTTKKGSFGELDFKRAGATGDASNEMIWV